MCRAIHNFKEINRGYVAFGGNPKGGKITGKGKIKTGKLDFDNVYFVKELKFNLFSVSQMCDKKNSVLFTDNECVVLSYDFNLPEENHVLLRVPRENNMYNVDLKNVVPLGDLTCLFAKATLVESNLWQRRLGHINFKTMNKLVKDNLVNGLQSQVFEINHTCVACKKGKQHRASCKSKPVNSVSQPLQRLHMDLFGPTFIKSLNKTSCFPVVTDDYSRVLVTKPHNKTPYELLLGRTTSIGFMRPFGCSVTILNTIDPLGKFDGKADEGFLVGYSVNSNAFRVFNSRTRIVQETLHINFLENPPNVTGSGPKWLFDIDTLTQSINYQPVVAGNQLNHNAGIQENIDAGKVRKEIVSTQQYVLLPLWSTGSQDPQNTDVNAAFDVKENENEVHVSPSGSDKTKKHDERLKEKLKERVIGCSRYMIGNISYLLDFKEINRGYVAFGGNPKGGKITSKGKIKTGKLDFDNVYFVKELKFNLFSVSQICDKKNSVLFTNNEYVVLSYEFNLPDENHVLLRVPRENNMYNVDLKNVVPLGDLTCLFAKATLVESNLWHRRLGHINFKIMNKLVMGNLVRGLQSKVFEINHTCVACKKGKQHRASYPLGKFDGKANEGFLVGYSINSNAFRVFNSRTRIVQETLHINFLENLPNVIGSGPKWLFDIDTLTQSINYQPVVAGNQLNHNAGIQENIDAGKVRKEIVSTQQYVLLPLWSTGSQDPQNTDAKREAKGKSLVDLSTRVRDLRDDFKEFSVNSANRVNATNPPVTIVGPNPTNSTNSFNVASPFDNAVNMPALEDIVYSDDEEDVGTEANFSNLETNIFVSPILTTRVHKDHPVSQIIGELTTAPQTRSMARMVKEQDMPALEDIVYSDDKEDVGTEADFSNLETNISISPILTTRVHKDHHVSQIIGELTTTPQTRSMARMVLVDLPKGKRAIGLKWVIRNKKDEREIVIRNKAQLVAQGHTQEEGIDYKEVFALVARIEVIWLFLAYASFMGFMVYQIDVKSAFLYETIEEEVYVFQPPGFKDPDYPNKVYKVVKALYGLQQALKLVKQKDDGIFISQDKYVAKILRKFGLIDGKSASTPIDTKKPLLKDPNGDPNREVLVNETFHVQTDDELTEKELKQIEADDQAIQTILLGLPEDIYAAVGSCETAQEI
uniref:Putative ribonuclease H-like domain-containing protein n=1 Tax=Tanacetum cinerariifolium TaxID=118510 RepID=A0A6L2JA38_TANCI|nr:putative ribonuclease H-like domain-containing protein [Tanacetum cinerariifolium]